MLLSHQLKYSGNFFHFIKLISFNQQEPLLKCSICNNLYHLNCSSKMSPLPKNAIKKKFTCGACTKSALHNRNTEPPKSLLVNRKSEGFPGFAHDDSSKPEQKTTVEPKKVKLVCSPKNSSRSTSSKLSVNDCKVGNDIALNFDIKIEKKSPTPEQEPSKLSVSSEQEVKIDVRSKKAITVRTDLVPNIKQDYVGLDCDEDRMDIQYDMKTIITPHESVPDVRKWDCDEVYTYFMGRTTPEFAQLLKDNQIDGDALLLIKREDVLNRFNLKLGPALRLYSHIVTLQYKNNNPILAWNEF